MTQKKICKAILGEKISPSLVSSISANLDIGVKQGLYLKIKNAAGTVFKLADSFAESKQFKWVGFLPPPEAINIVKKRAHAQLNKT